MVWRASSLVTPSVLLLCGLSVRTAAQDAVILSASGSPQGWVRIRGQLETVSDRGVYIRGDDGTVREYAGRRLLRVETSLLPEHQEGNRLFAQGEFAGALKAYTAAQSKESRPFVAAQIRIQIVWCLRYLGRRLEACREFFAVAAGDIPSAFASAAPVSWLPGPVEPALEALCASQLASPSPLVALVAASYLVTGPRESQALVQLDRLAVTASEPVRTLAWFQSCRRRIMTVNEAELRRWEEVWEKLPVEWRAGPTAVIAQGWEAAKDYEQAALWWLRLPILFAGHRDLAARGLLAAGRNLERLGRTDQASELYRELLRKYPESPDCPAAQARLEAGAKISGAGPTD
ncbi:MAG: tetratricopeptide repeat protein [Thermoguttaceae bacterium]|nr:tetratricopeptide repeat protein [Thermoguttaceae bacterium]MDW8079101.1 tetratricopeptide repeat protein [Thermoguttaceae bacterium]